MVYFLPASCWYIEFNLEQTMTSSNSKAFTIQNSNTNSSDLKCSNAFCHVTEARVLICLNLLLLEKW